MPDLDTQIQAAVNQVIHLAPHLRDDLESEAALVCLQYTGVDPHQTIVRRLRKVIAESRQLVLEVKEHAAKPVSAAVRRKPTPGQRRRLKRNLLIHACRQQGYSYRLIADAFGISNSRVHRIVTRELPSYFQEREGASV